MFAGRYRATAANNQQGTRKETQKNTQDYTSPRSEKFDMDEISSLPKEVMDTMSIVRLSWDFMTVQDFSATPYALSLMDGGSGGRNLKDFLVVNERLEKSMDIIVNDSKKRINVMRSDLEKSKELLECKRFDLLHLWVKSMQLKEMGRVLDCIDELQRTPDRLEVLIHGKHYIAAVSLMIIAQRNINSVDLVDIGALEGIKNKLISMKEAIGGLAKPYISKKRFRSCQAISRNVHVGDLRPLSDKITPFDFGAIDLRTRNRRAGTEIEEYEADEESDSYKFIQTIIESLYHLDRLPQALAHVAERAGLELYNAVERTILEHEIKEGLIKEDGERVEIEFSHERSNQVLGSFLRNLYQKFQYILEGHIFMIECAKKVSKGPNSPESILSPLNIGAAIQNEVKALICDYLTILEMDNLSTSNNFHINEILKDQKKIKDRGAKQVFHINTADPFEYVTEQYLRINRAARESPNIIADAVASAQTLGVIDKYANNAAAVHRLLVKPSPSYILTAFKPTADFTRSMEDMLGMKIGSFQKIFLNDFMLNVYVPLIEQQVNKYYTININGIDAFQTDKYPDIEFPLIKSAVHVILLFQTLSGIIPRMPVHRGDIVQILYVLLQKYLEKCQALYDAVITFPEQDSPTMAISAEWSKNASELKMLLAQNTYLHGVSIDRELNILLNQKETAFELKKKGGRSFHRSELIFEPRKHQSLANLELSDISGASLINIEFEKSQNFSLELSHEMSEKFNALQAQFKELMNLCIFTLRLEIRYHTIFFLDLAIREGSYYLEENDPDPDSYITFLNSELSNFDELLGEYLPLRIHRFTFDGLAQLISDMLFHNIKYIRRFNVRGAKKLIKSVDSIQQNLTNFDSLPNVKLSKIKAYYELLRLNGKQIVEYAANGKHKFNFDEYKVIFDLLYMTSIQENDEKGMKEYHGYLDALKDYFVKHRE